MSHLLIVDLPGGNDTDILEAALSGGHHVSLLTADPAHYTEQSEVARVLDTAGTVMDAGAFTLAALLPRLQALHSRHPFDAVLCLQDLRIVEASQIARSLGLRHLNPETAALCRDKPAVRDRLAEAGITQPFFAKARGPTALLAAVAAMGLPVVVKPTDGFGSQNVFALHDLADLEALRTAPGIIADAPGIYGLGVTADGTMLVERLLTGRLIGCDTLSVGGRHILLGINDKLLFAPPSFAIRGGCFTPNRGQFAEIEAYVFAVLDAIGFDHGAAHIELMITDKGPRLIEVNPRLVGAGIARLISAATGRSVHADLIALHADGRLPPAPHVERHAVTRWLAAPASGILQEILLPPLGLPGIVEARLLAHPGETVNPPYDNADRLGCVMTCGQDRAAAEARAEAFIADTRIRIAQAA